MKKADTPEAIRARELWAQSDHDPDATFNTGGLKHGFWRTPTYEVWANLRRRANRGDIPMCESWRRFVNFINDVGEKPEGFSLRRWVKHDAYGPTTCLWRPLDERQPGVSRFFFDPKKPHISDQSYYEWVERVTSHAEATKQI